MLANNIMSKIKILINDPYYILIGPQKDAYKGHGTASPECVILFRKKKKKIPYMWCLKFKFI